MPDTAASAPKAHVIDDDDGARDSLAFLLSTANVPVETYPSAGAFLTVARQATPLTSLRMRKVGRRSNRNGVPARSRTSWQA